MQSTLRTISILAALAVPGISSASSEAAWDKFAKDVEQKCTDAASSIFRKPQIAVDPTGTETYGAAIVYGRLKEGKDRAAVICVMDKRSGKVELGSQLGTDVLRVRKPKPAGQDDNAQSGGNADDDQ